MTFRDGMSPDERVDELVHYVDSAGGAVSVNDLMRHPAVRDNLGPEQFMVTLERAMAFGRVGARDLLSVVYTEHAPTR